eukprot:jgi/Mesvir1/26330/Mv22509-RA.1
MDGEGEEDNPFVIPSSRKDATANDSALHEDIPADTGSLSAELKELEDLADSLQKEFEETEAELRALSNATGDQDDALGSLEKEAQDTLDEIRMNKWRLDQYQELEDLKGLIVQASSTTKWAPRDADGKTDWDKLVGSEEDNPELAAAELERQLDEEMAAMRAQLVRARADKAQAEGMHSKLVADMQQFTVKENGSIERTAWRAPP